MSMTIYGGFVPFVLIFTGIGLYVFGCELYRFASNRTKKTK